MGTRVVFLSAALVGTLGAAPAPTSWQVAVEGTGSGNLTHVRNVPHTTLLTGRQG